MLPYIFRILPLVALILPVTAADWTPLFNGTNLDGWTPVIQNKEVGKDPDRFVQVRDGAIHMYADTDPAATVPFGVIVHEKTFSRFHLSLEYRWGEKKFAPRKKEIRDAGLLYHASNTGKVWPDSIEYQIQEGDSGDIVFLPKAGLTWMRPDPENAPEGQGDPGMLPEDGGFPKDFGGTDFAYIGRFPVLDTLEGWNRVEVIVHADESAEHLINGKTVARIANLRDKDGSPVHEGKIALQLEGAELLYRDVKIRELGESLKVDRTTVALSAVKGQPTRKAQVVVINPSGGEIPAELSITGKDAASFKVSAEEKSIPPCGSISVTVEFLAPDSPGRCSAGLQVGSKTEGVFVVLQGIGLAAFEGKNEPTLLGIVRALGIPLDVGGGQLELDTKKDLIGQSKAIPTFRASGKEKVRITPLARFSPKGVTPFGIVLSGESGLLEKGRLADVSEAIPDAHQTLFPPLEGGAPFIEFDAPDKPFAFYMQGHKFVSFTDPAIKTDAGIPHTGRIYPVTFFQGREMKNSWLVGFEEAANGDYQDALFLIENAAPAN
ncbi:MAG: family 16 glycoside hydrolase [Verrucomicrobiota bacterium]